MNENNTHYNLTLKLSWDAKDALDRIAQAQGISAYKFGQATLSCAIKCCDPMPTGEQMPEAIQKMFEECKNIKRWSNDVKTIPNLNTTDAIIFYKEPGKKPCVKTYRKNGSSWSKNVALATAIEMLYPALAKRLKEFCTTTNVDYAEIILMLINNYNVNEEIQESFSSYEGYDTTPAQTPIPQRRWKHSVNND